MPQNKEIKKVIVTLSHSSEFIPELQEKKIRSAKCFIIIASFYQRGRIVRYEEL